MITLVQPASVSTSPIMTLVPSPSAPGTSTGGGPIGIAIRAASGARPDMNTSRSSARQQANASSQPRRDRGADVGERLDRIVEEHHTEPRHDPVERDRPAPRRGGRRSARRRRRRTRRAHGGRRPRSSMARCPRRPRRSPRRSAASSSAPVPQPMSSTRVAPARSAAAMIASVTGVKLESMRRSFSAHR